MGCGAASSRLGVSGTGNRKKGHGVFGLGEWLRRNDSDALMTNICFPWLQVALDEMDFFIGGGGSDLFN